MAYIIPSIEDFKLYFTRDFVYGVTVDTVNDADLTKARDIAICQINEALFKTQGYFDIGFYYLMAHFLVTDLTASTQGSSGKSSWMSNSHSVGSVSESYSIPSSITDNAYYSMIAMTSYGQKYLMLIYPLLVGQVFTSKGGTRA